MLAPSRSAFTRRASLLTLGVAGATSLAPRPLAAKKSANFLCKRQVGDCRAGITLVCEGPNCDQAVACCDFLATCDFTAFASCINRANQAANQP